MPAERIVIVGAGPAGFATARAYREHGGGGHLTLVGQEPLLPYERPPLTKEFLRGELDLSELPIEEDAWFKANEVDLKLGATVLALELDEGIVRLERGGPVQADAIVLATGSEPQRPDLPGMDDPSVLTLRTLADSIGIAERAPTGEPIVVIGSGFIGCEIAASLAMRGATVTMIAEERLPQLERLGEDAAGRIAGWLRELDVKLIADVTVSAVHRGRSVELDGGRRVDGSCVVLATGVRPRGELAAGAGLPMHDGAVVVDDAMCSSATAVKVLAAGDVAYAQNACAGRHLRVEHWGDALGQGKVAGGTLAGIDAHWESVPGFWSTIGEHTIKYAAWGDGYDESRLIAHASGGFTVWYSRGGSTVGVLSHDCDEDYEPGRELIRDGAPVP
jgi:3-phenylpropionate/trans-cinnamate dioxygenase ferredoxin reductase subunit